MTETFTFSTTTDSGGALVFPAGSMPTIAPAVPTREYVSGVEPYWSDFVYDSMASHAARMVSLHGDNLFDAMEDDGTVASCVEILKWSVAGDGHQVEPAISPRPDIDGEDGGALEGAPGDAELAAEVAAYFERAVAAMDADATLDDAIHGLLDAIGRGNSLAEPVWRYVEDGPDAGFHHLDSLRTKPRRNWSLVLDQGGRIAGFAIRGVPSRRRRLPRRYVPRSKGVLYLHNPTPGRPSGTPAYQAVYAPWNEKVLLRPERWKYTANFASPFLYGTTAENARDTTDSDGNVVSPVRAMLNMVTQLPRKKAGAGAYGSKVDILSPPGDGQAFAMAEAALRLEIVERLLSQPRGAARLASGPNEKDNPSDDLTYGLRAIKAKVERVLRNDLAMPLVADRYGWDVARRLTPYIVLGKVDVFYFSRFANAMERMVRSGAIPPQNVPEMWGILGMSKFVTARDMGHMIRTQKADLELRLANVELVRAQAKAAGQAPPQPTGA